MNVKKCDFPADSKIAEASIAADFQDAYSVVTDRHELDPLQIYLLMVNNTPFWINSLLTIRNKAVRLLGLRDVGRLGAVDNIRQDGKNDLTGVKLDIFTIASFSEKEMILKLNDKHLNILMSILLRRQHDKTEVIVSTAVNYNNMLGSIYMMVIAPFHRRVIMRLMSIIQGKVYKKKGSFF